MHFSKIIYKLVIIQYETFKRHEPRAKYPNIKFSHTWHKTYTLSLMRKTVILTDPRNVDTLFCFRCRLLCVKVGDLQPDSKAGVANLSANN